MSKIEIALNNVSFDYPLISQEIRSIKRFILRPIFDLKSENIETNFNNVFNNISLEIKEGDRVGVVGNNGSGKTTLLKLIAGIIFPSSGVINISGNISSIIDIGFGLNPVASGLDNIAITSSLKKYDRQKYKKFLRHVIDFSKLDKYLNYPINTYSEGMKLRLSFSMAVYGIEDILIMDEWISVGDREFQEKSNNLLNEIFKKNKISVIASHNLDLLNKICNRFIIIENKKVFLKNILDF